MANESWQVANARLDQWLVNIDKRLGRLEMEMDKLREENRCLKDRWPATAVHQVRIMAAAIGVLTSALIAALVALWS